MIPEKQLIKRAKKLYDDIDKAVVYIGGKTVYGVILKKTLDKNKLKVYVSMDSKKGDISKVEIYDKDGEVLQVHRMLVKKGSQFKFLAVCEIEVTNE